MKVLKNIWAWVIAVIGFLLVALKISNSKKNAAEAKAALSDTNNKHAELEGSRANIRENLIYLEKKKQELINSQPPSGLTPKQVEAYWASKERK